MFEVIYISPSCRQAVNFIDELAIKLKQRGIGGFDIDHKNIQLKSDKFIVSAVDIWVNNLGRSYHLTEYFIDKVSYREFSSKCEYEKLKYLKSRFREDTKEISEKELIEILKGV